MADVVVPVVVRLVLVVAVGSQQERDFGSTSSFPQNRTEYLFTPYTSLVFIMIYNILFPGFKSIFYG